MHVVTVNKGPAAFAYDGSSRWPTPWIGVFFFEGAVMDGMPVFNLVRETMPAVRIDGFRGVINTTCQLRAVGARAGQAFDDALREMQARGIAEADPSLDVEGWDAAAKTAALVNVLMGGAMTPHHVSRTGIARCQPADMADAVSRGRRIRLVASAHGVRVTRSSRGSSPRCWPAADPLAGLADTERPLPATDLLGEVGIVQREGSLTQTAYALLSDLTAHQPAAQRLEPSMTWTTRPA